MIVSTTLAGPGTEHIITAAIESVAGIVDRHLVIDTTPDGLLPAFASDDPRVIVIRWPWQDDFGAARNAALGLAAIHDATWAITVDTDERIVNPAVLRLAIDVARKDVPALSIAYADGSYSKPRAFRIPATERWHGRTHEAIAIEAPVVEGCAFEELPKSAEQIRAKRERDLALLEMMIEADPSEARWHYYIGDAYDGLEQYGDALNAWEECAAITKWDEEAAWSLYRAACLDCFALGRHDMALERCVRGMAHHPGIAELPWLAALACYHLGRHEHAVYWAEIARTHGHESMSPVNALSKRRGFRVAKGLREGPADVERFALAKLGARNEARDAEAEFQRLTAPQDQR